MKKNKHAILASLVVLFFVTRIKAQDTFNLNSYLTKDGYTKLELKKMPSGHLHISGLINGVEGNFIVDTGASGTVIEIKNKKKFKMRSQTSDRQATGAGGSSIQMQASSNNNFKIGSLNLENINLMLMSLDHVNRAFEQLGLAKVDGVIGADILTNHKAIIDYANLSVYLKM